MSPVTDASSTPFPADMSYPLRVRIQAQGHVFSRRDALQFGASDEQLRSWRRADSVCAGGRGVYYLSSTASPGTAESTRETDKRRIRAVLLAVGEGHVATHESALIAWDLPVLGLQDDVHVGHPGGRRWTRRPQVRPHRLPPHTVLASAGGIATVEPAYAVAQVGMRSGTEAAVVAADAAMHRSLVRPAALAAAFARCAGMPGCSHLVPVLDLADPRSESPGESRLRLVLRAGGVEVTPQVTIRDELGRFVARVDLRIDSEATVVEFDGLLKYRGADGGGDFVAEKRRERALQRLGYRVIRFTWDDLEHPERVLAALRDPWET